MLEYILVSLGELLDRHDEENIACALKKFSCQRERDLEDFLHNKAIHYDRIEFGKTYLFLDKEELHNGAVRIIAYYTIAQSTLDLSSLSNNQKRKLLGQFPGRDSRKSIATYLVGQLGRADGVSTSDLPGSQILNECYNSIKVAIKAVGGRLLLLECREHMFSKFYEKVGFKKLYQTTNEEGLYTLYRRLDF